MNTLLQRSALLPLALLAAALGVPFAAGRPGPQDPVAPQDPGQGVERSIELFALDPLRSNWNLATSSYGRVIQEGEYRSVGSHLAFHETPAGRDEILVGLDARKSRIVDLGDLRQEETGFTCLPALFVERDAIRIVNPRQYGRTVPTLARLDQPVDGMSRLEARLGHVYFVEAGTGRDAVRAFVRIIRHVDGQSVTLSCRRIE